MTLSKRARYSQVFREQALEKVYSRGNRIVKEIAEELNINPWILKNWMKAAQKPASPSEPMKTQRPQDVTLSERFQLILDSQGKDESTLSAWCRERGIFPHHLQAWREDFEAGSSHSAP